MFLLIAINQKETLKSGETPKATTRWKLRKLLSLRNVGRRKLSPNNTPWTQQMLLMWWACKKQNNALTFAFSLPKTSVAVSAIKSKTKVVFIVENGTSIHSLVNPLLALSVSLLHNFMQISSSFFFITKRFKTSSVSGVRWRITERKTRKVCTCGVLSSYLILSF